MKCKEKDEDKKEKREKLVKDNERDEGKKAEREKLVKEEVPNKETWINWWKNQWRGPNSPRTEVHPLDDIIFRPPSDHDQNTQSQKKNSGTEPAKALDEAECKPDKTCDDTGNRTAYTRDKDLEGSHVLHKTK